MNVIWGMWKTIRGLSLLAVLFVIFAGVLLISCLARICYRNGFSEVAGKLRLEG